MDQQKDAQEFMTLFFSSLERNLVAHSNGHELHEFLRIRFEVNFLIKNITFSFFRVLFTKRLFARLVG